MWFHSAHHVTRGSVFYGDHDTYSEIYGKLISWYDVVIEKAIGLSGCEHIASPHKIMQDACIVLAEYQDPTSMSSLAIASTAHRILTDYNAFLGEIDKMLEDSGSLTLGLNDFHAAASNDVETLVYKIGQRIKSELEN